MTYDLVIRNGLIVDGSGMPAYRADVGIESGRITAIAGRIRSPARQTLDAEGHVVAPGFVDGHTHMDAQVFWDPLGTCACYHGVTTVVMGNCGFTLAPCREADADLVFRNLERSEDISREALLAGIKWDWESFPEYLDAVDRLPKGINYSGYVGHSALRTHVMGARAFTEEATEAELQVMCRHVQDALRAGAMGLSTSRSINHNTSDDRPVASRVAGWSEVEALVRAMGDLDAGIFEIAGRPPARDRDASARWYETLGALSAETGRPITFGVSATRAAPGAWRQTFERVDRACRNGARMWIQVHSGPASILLSFETQMPFDRREVWRELRSRPLEDQAAALRDPDLRRRLIEIARQPWDGADIVGAEARPPEWEWLFVMDTPTGPNRSVAEVARERGIDPVEAMIDLALEGDLKRFFSQIILNEDDAETLEMMRHPRSVTTFSDAGAHVSQMIESLQTTVLSHWVRDRQAFTLEEGVRLLTYDVATRWGFHDRGLVREGLIADLVVFDPDTVADRMPEVVRDLPGGAKRLHQSADGMKATIVNGVVVLLDNEPTGALPGRLLRARIPN